MERGGNAEHLWRAANLQQLKHASPAHEVESHCEINDEDDVQWHLLFSTFLLKLMYRENHVDCGFLSPESTLGFWVHAISEDLESS